VFKMTRIAISTLLLASSVMISSATPSLAQSKAVASTKVTASSWDGEWKGTSSAGGVTIVKIAGGKVTSWVNNGFPRAKVVGSVSAGKVTLDDTNSWKATMTMQGEGKARLTAAGIGNNGKPAKNTALLTKR